MTSKLAIYGGVLTGLITVLSFFVAYTVSPETMLSIGFYWASLVFYALGILLVLLRVKNQQNGLLLFKQALRDGFIVFLIANLLFFIFYFWLFKQDPGLLDIQLEQFRAYV
ncbi:MAG: DUF4199 domain-containing protein, partial [Saprospiraceae bacterium]|nr:DUF4199 domain-containing protein [Saprospiraceae bacterium]